MPEDITPSNENKPPKINEQVKVFPIKKAPHIRHLQSKVSSPSDNLSPCSQRLMAADRLKGSKPRSFNSRLAQRPHSLLQEEEAASQTDSTGHCEEIDCKCQSDETSCHNNEDLDEDVPPSPTRHINSSQNSLI